MVKGSPKAPMASGDQWLIGCTEKEGALNLLDCGYRNGSDRMVIVFLERVVFPFELLSFSCPGDAQVEIWTHGLGGAELLETIPARELSLHDSDTAPLPGPQGLPVGGGAQDDLLESWIAAG
jgi:hypothetical protein